MKIAYTKSSGPGATDRLLTRLAERLEEGGARLCGTIQVNHDAPGQRGCDMDVTVLPDGPVVRISQALGRHAEGCRLDPEALERAVSLTSDVLEGGAVDLLLVNKFGKHEAAGGGYRTLIARALELDLPVLVGLGGQNAEAFHAFTGGMGEALPSDLRALVEWCREAGVPVAESAEGAVVGSGRQGAA
ncbi:hypothetical protein BV394_04415 [Brevirhabdus pacifica]|uniref:Uncharacterized protein n=1 Tax=Brevirhabdus pacifica TaxID=1267768 RepID=A0A1U7DGD0_9RHOB|nr:DUF2478 domain-containing protein [Brevirhabdus pacifica]APX89060.1 hypothetical protein BV394_04415 [Brevirhabdus pacifica]PJJ86363.1 uncharacterized protein DUF2478 [Brevirhabdus pacifica]